MNEVIDFLYRDYYSNYNIIYLIKENLGSINYYDEHNLIVSYDDEMVFFVCNNYRIVNDYLKENPKINTVSINSNLCFDYLLDKFDERMEVNNWVYDSIIPIKLDSKDTEIRVLDISYNTYILNNYKYLNSLEHINKSIEKGTLGLFYEDMIVGFIGTHDEGSIGMLHIDKDYRKKGYGYLLEGAMINKILEKGVKPFCQVTTSNDISKKLQLKLGLNKSDKTIVWYF